MERKFYTVQEVSEMLGFTPRTIREFITSGMIEAVKFRTEYRITSEAIDEYTKQNSTKRDHGLSTAEDDPKHN